MLHINRKILVVLSALILASTLLVLSFQNCSQSSPATSNASQISILSCGHLPCVDRASELNISVYTDAAIVGPYHNLFRTTVLSTSTKEFSQGTAIQVQFKNMPLVGSTGIYPSGSDSSDWLTIVPADFADNSYGEYVFIDSQSGAVEFIDNLLPGIYEVRAYYGWPFGAYDVMARTRIRVVE